MRTTKKTRTQKVSRVPRAQRATESATIDRVRRKSEADLRRRGTKSIVHTDTGDHVYSHRYGFMVRREFLKDGRPAASNVGGDPKAQGSKFIGLVRSMALGFPDEIAGPILDPGLSRLTPAVRACIKNFQNACDLLSPTDSDYVGVRRVFTAMLTGKCSKALAVDARQAVVDAVNASGTKAASGAVRIAARKDDDDNVVAEGIEVADVVNVITHAAILGSELGENLNTDQGREALSRYIAGAIAGLANGDDDAA